MKIGAIFDWDGVVVNSCAEHLDSWKMLAAAHGHTIPENFMLDTFGKRNLEIIPDILKWTSDPAEAEKMSDEKEVYYRKIVAERGVPTVGGVREFLAALKSAGVPCAIGSSTPRNNLEQAIEKLGLTDFFTAAAAMEDVKNGKPAPDVFLCAAEKMGIPPRKCVVFEDSEAGIDAAIAAKMKCVAVATTHPAEFWESRYRGFPDIIINDFTPLSVSDIQGLFA